MSVRLIAESFSGTLAERLAAPRPARPTLHWLGQAGFVVDAGPFRLVIDPYLSDALAEKYAGSVGAAAAAGASAGAASSAAARRSGATLAIATHIAITDAFAIFSFTCFSPFLNLRLRARPRPALRCGSG